jgi:ABC-type oligopeptide transport system ATPase subunit
MYLGQIVELAMCEGSFNSPQQPYAQALLSSTPVTDPDSGIKRIILEGVVPNQSAIGMSLSHALPLRDGYMQQRRIQVLLCG